MRTYTLFCSYDFDLDIPTPTGSEDSENVPYYQLSRSRLSKVRALLQTDTQTDACAAW